MTNSEYESYSKITDDKTLLLMSVKVQMYE